MSENYIYEKSGAMKSKQALLQPIYSYIDELVKWNDDMRATRRAALSALEDANFSIEVLRRSEAKSRYEAEQQLNDHAETLIRMNAATASCELRLIELKKEVNELCKRLSEPPRYPLVYEKNE